MHARVQDHGCESYAEMTQNLTTSKPFVYAAKAQNLKSAGHADWFLAIVAVCLALCSLL